MHLQSQFRFDNECYLNLPENHKRVSLIDNTATENDTISNINYYALLAANMTGGEADIGQAPATAATGTSSITTATSSSVVVPATGAAAAAGAPAKAVTNINIASDDHNFASVSMLFFYFIIFIYLVKSSFV